MLRSKFFTKPQMKNPDLKSAKSECEISKKYELTDTGENVLKWTPVFSTRRWVILVARTRRQKREENSVVALLSLLNVFACGQVSSPRLYRLSKIQSLIYYLLAIHDNFGRLYTNFRHFCKKKLWVNWLLSNNISDN